jgi:lysozyme
MKVVFGIDISHFQRGLSLEAVQAQGYDYVIAKATQGQGVQDAEFHTFREEAQSLGLLFAAYHFLHSDSSADAQADNLAEHLNGHNNIPVMIDCEPTKGSSPTLRHVKRFIAACEKRGLRVSILYLPHFHWQAIGEPALHTNLPPVMQALYGKNRRGPGQTIYPGNESPRWGVMGGTTPDLLQFGSRGRIDGFKRLKVDVGAFRGDRTELVASGMFLAPHAKKAGVAKKAAPAKKVTAKKAAPAKKAAAKKAAPAKKVAAKKLGHTDDIVIRWRGHKLNARTILMLQAAERRLGQRVTITQGSFNPDVEASAGTHDRGGVLDISIRTGPRTQRKVRVLRKEGFAAWHRLPTDFKASAHVPEHIHAVSLFDHELSSEAAKQKTAYLGEPRLNGLKNKAPDSGPKVPIPAKPTLVKQTVRRREILFNETNDSVGFMQDMLGLTPDGFFGPDETQRFMNEQFGWNGKKPMGERLFRKLFPEGLFVLDATVPAAPAAPVVPAVAAAPVAPAAAPAAAPGAPVAEPAVPGQRGATAADPARR